MYTDLDRPPLHAGPLRQALVRPGSLWTAIEVVEATGSTNADLAAAARAGAPAGLVRIAEEQTAGRGRLDRTWTSPPRAGIAVSVLLRPAPPTARWSWLPLLTGLALARAVGRLGEVDAVLKWPNDLLVGPNLAKVAGILAEIAGDAVVVGIGLNVTTRADELPPAATSLALAGARTTDRDTLVRAVLRELAADVRTWSDARGDAESSGLRRAYRDSCDTIGRLVVVTRPGGPPLRGEAIDVDSDGRLVVDTPDGPQSVSAGDVTHVRPSP